MTDAGYGTAHNYIYTQEQQADAILSITLKNFCLYDADENKIPLINLLKEAEKIKKKWWISLIFVNTLKRLPLYVSLPVKCQRDKRKKQVSVKKQP